MSEWFFNGFLLVIWLSQVAAPSLSVDQGQVSVKKDAAAGSGNIIDMR